MESGTNWKRPWEDDGHGQYPYFARRMSVPAAYSTSHASYGSAPLSRSPEERKLPPITSAIDHSARPSGVPRQHAFPQRSEDTNGVRRPLTPPDFRKRPRSQYEQSQDFHAQRRPSEPIRAKSNGLGHAGFLAQIEEQRKATAGVLYPQASVPHRIDDLHGRTYVSSREKVNRDSSMSPPSKPCQNCKRVADPVREVVLGLAQLNQELRLAVGTTGYPDVQPPDVSMAGLKQAFDWMLHSITLDIGIARELAVTRSNPPSAVNLGSTQQQSLSSSLAMPAERALKRRTDKGRDEGVKRPRSGSIDVHSRIPEIPSSAASSFAQGGHSRRGSIAGDPQLSAAGSPHQTTSSGLSFSQSPMQAPPPTRMLPSPSSISFPTTSNTLPPISPSQPNTPSQSAHAAHFQDLQHQVSTKTLALQTLQREHDTLLSAFSRSQTRCATLDRKFQVSDAEINNLTEDRLRLQASVEGLESQVEDLIKSRDEARKQSVANGGQYMKILAMASKLEAQESADRKRWKSEKADLEDRIKTLEEQNTGMSAPISTIDANYPPVADGPSGNVDPSKDSLPAPARSSAQSISFESSTKNPSTTTITNFKTTPAIEDEVLNSTSLDILRAEVTRLRNSCHEMEAALNDLKTEGQQIDQLVQQFGAIGRKVVSKAENAIGTSSKLKDRGEPSETKFQESRIGVQEDQSQRPD
ncbi:MAG: hypothetical protein M1835_005284 [Candelina submexicana]|nr:MAG: hypothetical protein M1835_005284 [Candelina submexicana]